MLGKGDAVSRSALLALALASGALAVAATVAAIAFVRAAEDPKFWAGRR